MGRHASNRIHCEPKFVAQVIRGVDNGVRRIGSKSITKQQISEQEIGVGLRARLQDHDGDLAFGPTLVGVEVCVELDQARPQPASLLRVGGHRARRSPRGTVSVSEVAQTLGVTRQTIATSRPMRRSWVPRPSRPSRASRIALPSIWGRSPTPPKPSWEGIAYCGASWRTGSHHQCGRTPSCVSEPVRPDAAVELPWRPVKLRTWPGRRR